MMCRRRGPWHLETALVLATAVLCDLWYLGRGAGEEHHHGDIVGVGEEVHTPHGAGNSSGEGHNDHEGQNCGAHHGVERCSNAELDPHLLLANVMLGAVVFSVFVLYLLNWNNKYIQRATYRMLGTSMSVYCAVLLNEGLMGVLEVFSKIIRWEIEITFGLLIFLGLYSTVWWLCYKKQDDHKWLMALESLGGHLMAFAGIVAFGNMMFSCWFQHTIYAPVSAIFAMQSYVHRTKYVFVVILVLSFLLLLFACSRQFRENSYTQLTEDGETLVESGDSTSEDLTHKYPNKPWFYELRGAENEAVALIVGFLVLQASILFLTGKDPALHDHSCKSDVHLAATASLAGVGTVLLIIMPAVTIADNPGELPTLRLGKIIAMSGAWCIERSSKWLMIYCWDDSELAQVNSAFFLSLLTVIAMLILGKIMFVYDSPGCHRAADNLLESLAVLVGLAWEHAFHVCQATEIDYYVDRWKADGQLEKLAVKAILKAVMAVILCSVVAPGWVWYLLPAARKPV